MALLYLGGVSNRSKRAGLDPGNRRLPGNFEVHGIYGRAASVFFTNDPIYHPERRSVLVFAVEDDLTERK